MKKIISLSILTILATMLLAIGTYALFSKTTGNIDIGNVNNKQFYIGNNITGSTDIKLAPSEKEEIEFTVTNYEMDGDLKKISEIPMYLTVEVTLNETKSEEVVCPINFYVIINDKTYNAENGVITVPANEVTFQANVEEAVLVKIVADWAQDENDQIAQNMKDTAWLEANGSVNISVTLTGTQIVNP